MNGTYIILGATGGVGRTLARKLTRSGSKVIAAVRNPEKATAIDHLSECFIYNVDASSWESVETLFKTAHEDFGQIDGVAVCVGSILLKPAHLTRPDEFEAVLNQNLIPCLATIRSCAKGMMSNGGSIVFVSSAVANQGFPNHEAIAAAKAGIRGLTLSAAASYASYGIRVNCVAPGLVESEMSLPITINEHSLKASQRMHALGRIGTPEDIASAIAWLLDSDQSWVTGQTIGVDGGLSNLYSKAR